MQRTLLKILTCCSIVLLFNCQHDDFIKETDAHAHDNGIIINRISGQELKAKVPLVFKKAQSLNQPKNTDALARGVRIDDEYEVETDEVIEISKDGITHYTFSISRTVPTGLVENLVISVDADGILTGKIVTYDLTEEEKQAVALNNYVNLIDKMSIRAVENSIITDLFSRTGDCITLVWAGDSCPSREQHTPEEIANGECSIITNPNIYLVQIIVDGDCINGGGGSDGSGGTTNPTNPGTNPTNPGTGGGGGTPNPDPVITTPLLEVRKDLIHCQQLKKLLEDNSTNSPTKPNIKPKLEQLKLNAQAPINYETGYSFSKDPNNQYSDTELQPKPNSTNQVGLDLSSGNVYASSHTHTAYLYPMFSWDDMFVLFRIHLDGNTQVKEDAVIFMVTKTCITCTTTKVYAVKIENWTKFRAKINTDLNNPKTIGYDLEEKIEYANDKFLEKFENETNLEKMFLEEFANAGISLFEADEDLTNWSQLKLSGSPLTPVSRTPCN